eukprot:TRINITY_DN4554_c1_g1_i2.p1 TRINITY_DN4554_c1_g1~~TRINITY_DN4554_c1_g1_i2.p1  ORF type:complete len:200 (+),score=32.58 TRINITY_DN4554_c1_g1_i2:757-1356(+)
MRGSPIVCCTSRSRGGGGLLFLLFWVIFLVGGSGAVAPSSSSAFSSAGDARARRAGGGVEREEGHHYSVPEMTVPGFLYTRPRGRCTPQFWSSRREAWPRMVPEMASVSKVFGSLALERYRWDLTLLEATERNDDGTNAFSHLLKQSTAALLNSYSRTGFPYTPWEVKTLFIQSLVSVQAAAHQANLFSQANNNIASCV